MTQSKIGANHTYFFAIKFGLFRHPKSGILCLRKVVSNKYFHGKEAIKLQIIKIDIISQRFEISTLIVDIHVYNLFAQNSQRYQFTTFIIYSTLYN